MEAPGPLPWRDQPEHQDRPSVRVEIRRERRFWRAAWDRGHAGAARAGGQRMARITATEMVGVPFTTKEARRLLDAIAEGKLGPPEDPENVALQRKLGVL